MKQAGAVGEPKAGRARLSPSAPSAASAEDRLTAGETPCRIVPGLELFNRQRFWDAHERLENEWKELVGEDRNLYKGIIQLAAGFFHVQRQNSRGALRLIDRGLQHLATYRPRCLGIDVEALRAAADRARSEVVGLGSSALASFDSGLFPRINYAGVRSPAAPLRRHWRIGRRGVALMRAVVVEQFGPPQVLRYGEAAEPEVREGQVLVRVAACGVNHLDLFVRRDGARLGVHLPHIPGSEVAGEVVEAGPGVSHVPVGQRVAIAPFLHDGTCEYCLQGEESVCLHGDVLGVRSSGGYADLVAAPARSVLRLPEGLRYQDAAAVTLSTLTAWHMLVSRARLRPGETVLVLAGGSGVGSGAIQVARLLGARVIATAGSASKRLRARQLGADEAVDHTASDWAQEVRRLTANRGVDVVVEHVGPATWPQSIAALARNGRLVTCGATTGRGAETDLWALFGKQLQLIGCYGGTRAELEDVLRLTAAGKLRAAIDRVLPLARAAEAHRLLEAREQFGKVLLEPEQS